MGATMAGLVLVLVLVGISFGTSALLFPVLIAAVIGLGVGVLYIMRTAAAGGNASGQNPRSGGAPASGEGSDPAHPPR
jgi:hypothetical protein